AFDELAVGDSVNESGDSHPFWGSFNMPTLSFKPLHEIFRRFSFSLLDVVDLYRILDALLLLKEFKVADSRGERICFLACPCGSVLVDWNPGRSVSPYPGKHAGRFQTSRRAAGASGL
ncbi:hypothetical protein Tco_0760011, partial [Tanacetum coccineum]